MGKCLEFKKALNRVKAHRNSENYYIEEGIATVNINATIVPLPFGKEDLEYFKNKYLSKEAKQKEMEEEIEAVKLKYDETVGICSSLYPL